MVKYTRDQRISITLKRKQAHVFSEFVKTVLSQAHELENEYKILNEDKVIFLNAMSHFAALYSRYYKTLSIINKEVITLTINKGEAATFWFTYMDLASNNAELDILRPIATDIHKLLS